MTDAMTEDQMKALIQERIAAVADKLAIDESSLYKYLPHFAPAGSQPKAPFSYAMLSLPE